MYRYRCSPRYDSRLRVRQPTGCRHAVRLHPGQHRRPDAAPAARCAQGGRCIEGLSDTMSGARDDRPGLAALMDQLRAGDTVVVWKLDRLGRNMLHILETVKVLTERGVTLVSTSDGIDSSTAAGRMMIGVLGSLAEYERELVNERTALKRAASRASGTKFGLPRKVDDAKHIATATRMMADGHTGKDIAKYLGVGRATLYRYLDEAPAFA